MKRQSEQKTNPIKVLLAVGALTLLGVCAKDITTLGGRACVYVGKQVQPVVDTGKKIFQEVNAPCTPYASVLSNEVDRVESLFGSGKSLDAHFNADKLLKSMRIARGNDPSLNIEPLARRTLKVLEGTTLDFSEAYKESIADFGYH